MNHCPVSLLSQALQQPAYLSIRGSIKSKYSSGVIKVVDRHGPGGRVLLRIRVVVRLFVLSALRNDVLACALGVVKLDRLAACYGPPLFWTVTWKLVPSWDNAEGTAIWKLGESCMVN